VANKGRRPRGSKRPGPFALPGDRYPIGDLKHANFAVTRLYMKNVTDGDRKTVIKAIKKLYPKNENLKFRIEKLQAAKMTKKKKKTAKKKPVKKKAAKKKAAKKKPAKKKPAKKKPAKRKKTTKKGDTRKTSRKAYKGIKKKTRKRKETGIMSFLTSELIDL
jgi:hypothetical protein